MWGNWVINPFAVGLNRCVHSMGVRLAADPWGRGSCPRTDLAMVRLLTVAQVKYAWGGRKTWGQFLPEPLNI